VKILPFKSFYKKKKRKKKKRKEKTNHPCSRWVSNLARRRYSIAPRRLTFLVKVNFTTYFFSRDKVLIGTKMLVFFLGKCVRTAVKTMVVDRNNQKALALLYLASGPLWNAANSSVARPSSQQNPQQRWSLQRQIRNLNFSPSTKKTTEYSFERFLSINKIFFDFCCLC